jgi:predicted NACHT family NTPase
MLKDANLNIMVDKIIEVERSYKRVVLQNDKLIKKRKKALNALDNIGIETIISSIADLAVAENNEEIQEIAYKLREIEKTYERAENRIIKDRSKYTKDVEIEISNLKSNISHIVGKKLLGYIDLYETAKQNYRQIELELVNIGKQIRAPMYEFTIDGHNVCNFISKNQNTLKCATTELLNSDRTPSKVSSFIDVCQKVLNSTEKVLSHEYLSEAAGLPKDKHYVNMSNLDRINFSIHEIFDTGKDFVVFGEAGAGKTTTLQFYARKKIENNDKDVVLYIPLARSFYKLNLLDATELDYMEYLIRAVVHHLATQDINIDINTIKDIARDRSSLFIFDGIDEVIDKVPWIIKALYTFKENFPRAQILTSSRLSGKYINDVPFFGLSLLPFDDQQRDEFIGSWFKDPVKLKAIKDHLHSAPELNEIVRNPLLATILCVLAEYDIPLPDSEIRLYEERMSLLLGFYDLQKQTFRLKSHHSDLLVISKKIAYVLHLQEARYSKRELITEKLCDYYESRFSRSKILLAVDELIDPCNILVPMTDEGQVGFGHLRFQEYLVACEIKENRSIHLLDHLPKLFWRGAFILFSKMSDNIYPLIEDIIERCKMTDYLDAIEAMLKVRSAVEQENLLELINHNVMLDKFDRGYW